MAQFSLEEFLATAHRIQGSARTEGRLVEHPTTAELRCLAKHEAGVTTTIYGNLAVDSEPNSRAAKHTKSSVDAPFGDEERLLLRQCEAALAEKRLVSIDRMVGDGANGITVRLVVPEEFAHLAYGGGNLFARPDQPVAEPTYQIIMFTDSAYEVNKSRPLPQKDVTIRLAMFPDGRVVKIVRNSMYTGEYKKGVFAAEDWNAKAQGHGIFLHAGCRSDYLESVQGDYRWVRSLLIALSANGKTSTTARVIARKRREQSWLVQDDGGTLAPDGSFHGFEAGGIYVKTDGLNPGDQIETYYGMFKPGTFSENVYVDATGDFDFYNVEKTSNGRAIIRRADFMHASQEINVPKVDNLILITRGNIVPAVARLTHAQAAAMMVLGQSMESSAGDPTRAGTIINQFFYDPFVAGDRAEHANLFHRILGGLAGMNCYLINTGGVGEGERYHDIRLRDTVGILEALFRGAITEFEPSPTGFSVPVEAPGIDPLLLHPERLYDAADFAERQKAFDAGRQAELVKYPGLHPEILSAFAQ